MGCASTVHARTVHARRDAGRGRWQAPAAAARQRRPLPRGNQSDGRTHLMWKPREAAVPPSASSSPASSPRELDLLLLPNDAQMDRASDFNGHPVTAARIYRLSYSDGDAYYFWMQEPSIESDDVFFNRVQHVLAPPVYTPDAPNKGWTWESDIHVGEARAALEAHDEYGRGQCPGVHAAGARRGVLVD